MEVEELLKRLKRGQMVIFFPIIPTEGEFMIEIRDANGTKIETREQVRIPLETVEEIERRDSLLEKRLDVLIQNTEEFARNVEKYYKPEK